uniref:F-box only protein 28 n=1 Tax=Bactrocera dorsalis TaxID=27457 RepID=A0A034VVL5_BACDO
MVSTRQMATNCGSGSLNQNSATSDSARLNTMSTQTQRGMIAPSAMPTRQCGHHQSIQQNQQQLVKENDTTATAATNENTVTVQLLDMPVEVLSKIFAYVGYRKVGQMRVISSRMNDVCMDILNSTFSRLITQTYNRFHAIKANMPRRESARRNHPLACECDIIETCYMRLSLLQMTFGKHIERGHCCFFPGAILDEVYNILTYIRNTPRLERPYRVTDELFDLSTMAMEYFRDRIEQTLPDIAYFNKDFFKLPTTTKRPALVASVDHADSASTSPPQSNMVLRKGIRKIKQGMKIYNNQLSVLRNELRNCKRKSSEQGKQIAEQQKLLAEQQKQTLEYANRLDENDKKNEEIARKFSTLLQELNKCKTELQYWRSKSPAIPICTSCGQKLAPSLPPPEDFQALVNQGVKPEDIILNLSDTDTDIGREENTHESNSGSGALTAIIATQSSQAGAVFAFPDKDTTAKLLAFSSTVNKNQLKRQHFSASSTSANLTTASNDGHSAFNIYASGSSSSSSSSLLNYNSHNNSSNDIGNGSNVQHFNGEAGVGMMSGVGSYGSGFFGAAATGVVGSSTSAASDYSSSSTSCFYAPNTAQGAPTAGVVNPTTMLSNYCDAAMMMAAAAVNANQCLQQHHRMLLANSAGSSHNLANGHNSHDCTDDIDGAGGTTVNRDAIMPATSISAVTSPTTSTASTSASGPMSTVNSAATSISQQYQQQTQRCPSNAHPPAQPHMHIHDLQGQQQLQTQLASSPNLIDISEVPLVVDVK